MKDELIERIRLLSEEMYSNLNKIRKEMDIVELNKIIQCAEYLEEIHKLNREGYQIQYQISQLMRHLVNELK